MMYLINVTTQLHLMNKFLMTDNDSFLGFKSVQAILSGQNWEMSAIFPRVSMCDFQVGGDFTLDRELSVSSRDSAK